MDNRPPTEGEALLFMLIIVVSATVLLNFIIYVFTN